MKTQLLEWRGCNYADYDNDLKETVEDWGWHTGRMNIRNRKDWEFITMARFAEKYGKLDRVYDGACGREPLIDWLAKKSKTVVCTDLWERTYLHAAGIELEDYLTFWRNFENVFPMVMNSVKLDFFDDCFDASFCVSSIEHIGPEDGSHAGAQQAVEELIRVTKPGGLVAFSTEVKPDADADAWYFSPVGLSAFLGKFAATPPIFDWKCPDGDDEKFGVRPVAFALRKI